MRERLAPGGAPETRPAYDVCVRASAALDATPLDLHTDISQLLEMLVGSSSRGDATDGYLAACGIAQLVEDWRDGTGWRARHLSAMLGDHGPVRRSLRASVNAAAAVLRGRPPLREIPPLIDELADAVMSGLPDGAAHIPERARTAVRGVRDPTGGLRGEVLRPPSSFRSFDQHPRDVSELARRFARSHPNRETPLLVLGVRTSGGYLAPLAASALRALGYRGARSATTRPGAPLPSAALREVHAAGGLVLVIDDPPSSGASMAAVARAVRRRGFAAEQIVPIFAAFGPATAPAALAEYACVILPATDWHIRAQLGGSELRTLVAAAFPGRNVVAVTAAEPGPPSREAHLAVRLTAHLQDEHGITEAELVAEGVGQGYLGRHAQLVAERLAGLVPPVYLVRDGVMLRAGGPEVPVANVPPDAVAAYAVSRQRILATEADRSGALAGRQPVWEVGARVLARGFGRLGPLLRPALIDPSMRNLLASEHPCVVDGNTAAAGWLSPRESAIEYMKTDFDDGCFSHLDLAVYDALYDLAGVAIQQPGGSRALIEAFEHATGERADPARWCAFQLVQAWNLERAGRGGAHSARAAQTLFGQVFLADLDTEPDGPWCALDVDGVLELDFGGFPTTTIAAMSALRALRAHGYRVMLATGRSIPDVRDRCAAYRLAGGVGEYGAAFYDPRTSAITAVHERASDPAQRAALVADLTALPSVSIDPDYRYCVRASRGGKALDPDALRRLAAPHPGFRPLQGDAQTDFVPVGVEKSIGVRELMSALGAEGEQVEFAMGDTAADLGILRMARVGRAPAHARRSLAGAGVAFTRSSYQAGLAQAVGRLIGHRPGSCAECRLPRLSRGEALVLGLLSAGQSGARGLPVATVRLARLRACALLARRGGLRWE